MKNRQVMGVQGVGVDESHMHYISKLILEFLCDATDDETSHQILDDIRKEWKSRIINDDYVDIKYGMKSHGKTYITRDGFRSFIDSVKSVLSRYNIDVNASTSLCDSLKILLQTITLKVVTK